jgi:hypothetical protein
MTIDDSPDDMQTSTFSRALLIVGFTTVMCIALLLLLSGSAWRAPFQYADDLFLSVKAPLHSNYHNKLMTEGRWLVWLWHVFIPPIPVALHFVVAIFFWCCAMALIAWRMAAGVPMLAVSAGLALVFNPQVLNLFFWPLTATPMMFVLFCCAVLIGLFGGKSCRNGLVLSVAAGVAATMLSMQLFALVVIGAALAATFARVWQQGDEPRTALGTGVFVIAGGVIGGVVGILAGSVANWLAFEHFGLKEAAWRAALLETDGRIDLAVANINQIVKKIVEYASIVPFVLGIGALGGILRLVPQRPVATISIVVVLVGIAGSVAVIPLVTEVPATQERGGMAMWLAVVVAIVFASFTVPRGGVLGTALLIVVASCGAWKSPRMISQASIDGSHDDRILEQVQRDVADVATPEARRVVGYGDGEQFRLFRYNNERDAWYFQTLLLERFEGDFVEAPLMCTRSADCPEVDPRAFTEASADGAVFPQSGYVRQIDDVIIIDFGGGE